MDGGSNGALNLCGLYELRGAIVRGFCHNLYILRAETKVGRRRERGGFAVQLTPPKVSADQIRAMIPSL
jgi:hypothetical protein